MPRPYFYDKNKVQEIIRVDHAGEYGAKRIYEGQLHFTTDSEEKSTIRKMLVHELEHLKYFQKQIEQGKARPTLFMPLWDKLGFALGAISKIFGYESAMMVTEGVEEVIVDHYQQQINYLQKHHQQPELVEALVKFRSDEDHHIQIARKNNSQSPLFYRMMKGVVKSFCHLAIVVSKKI